MGSIHRLLFHCESNDPGADRRFDGADPAMFGRWRHSGVACSRLGVISGPMIWKG
jgi:hypothetical protein